MSQEIIKIEDIVGGDNLVKKQELNEFVKKNEVGTAASKDEDYFAKADEVPLLPQYTLEIKREDIVWTDDYITIPHSTYLRDKKIEVYKALLRKGSGDIILNPRVSYPRSETYNSVPPNEFYLKDGDGYITKSTDFEYIHIEYSIFSSTELYNYDVRNQIGENVIQDENSGELYHSREMRKVFIACYPELWAQYGIESAESLNDPQAGNSTISANFEPRYMELKKANMLFRPYVNGALSEQTGSNPNILKVGAHYGNWGQFGEQQERNITSADDVFLTNVVAVTARVDDEITTEFQATYGRGVEFFEDITKLDVEFPEKTYLKDRAIGIIDETGLIFSAPTYPDWVSKSKFQAGEKVYINLGTNDHDDPDASTAERAVVAEIINDYTVRFETALTPGDGKIAYIYGDLTMLGGQQQSPTCSIVGAKLKKIKLLSGANWQIVREAARMTAKKTIDGVFDNYLGHWDKFRGFGKIQPDDAIQYIKDTYTENEDYLNTLASDAERVHGINPLIPYSNITDNTPINKGQIKAEFVAKEIGKSLIADTEIARLAGVTNQTLSELGGEALANKKLVLTDSDIDYPTSKAVKTVTDNLKKDVMVNSKSITTLENVLSDANINQEARVTTSGVDTISLPKTAANTGMQVQLFGQNAQNMVVNGDFRNGTTGWVKLNSTTISSYQGGLLISAGTHIVDGVGLPITSPINGNKYYLSSRLKPKYTTNIFSVELRTLAPFLEAATSKTYTNNQWINLSGIITGTTSGSTQLQIIMRFDNAGDVAGSEILVDNVKLINLTATFGAGNEPNKDQCDILFANYFEGTDNVIGTGRIRSVNSSGLNPSYLYFNGGQLRSNGLIKDEIRKGTNGYELVKRVGVGTLGVNGIAGGDFEGGLIGSKFDGSDSVSTWKLNTQNPISGTNDGRLKVTTEGTNSRRPYLNFTISRTTGQLRKLSFSYKVNSATAIFSGYNSGGLYVALNITLSGSGVYSHYYVCSESATNLPLYFDGRNLFDLQIDNLKDELVNTADGETTSESVTVLGGNIHYTLGTPIITPIPHAGLLNSNSNGTAYFEPIIADAGVYSSNLAIQLTDYPIASFESIRKYANGTYTDLNPATAVIASGGLSFTHPDLVSGDLVMFTYAYNKESIGRSMTLTHYDNRYVKVDTANGKTYRIDFVVTNGVVVPTATEV